MKPVKRILLASVLVLGAFCAVMYSSCSKSNNSAPNPCTSITCANGGTCDSATASCSCVTGYEGSRCDTLARTKFIKSWTATDYVTGGSGSPVAYTSIISAAGTSIVTEVQLTDFSDFFINPVNATVSGTTITIASQYPEPSPSPYSVSGSGTIANNKITWAYTIKNDSTGTLQKYNGTWQ